MITLEHVKKTFNKHHKNKVKAIDDTSLKLGDTGLVALLGPSGSGKTTLLNMLGGLDRPNRGKIYINGIKITRKSTHKIDKVRNLNIGYIFQDYKLIDNLSVYDNVALVLKMIGIKDKEEIKKRVNFVLETLNIYRFRNRPADMLSGGERQRVGIARAIVKDPNIIIADEPTGNLDSKNSLEIMNIIKNISKNRLVILVTHEVTLANFFASRIIEIEDGKVIKDYENNNNDKLDYIVENDIYLKDIPNHEEINKDNYHLNLYNYTNEKIDVTLVVRNGNIYLKENNDKKIEALDNNSSIELIDDHYKKMDQNEVSKYEFNFQNVINNNYKRKYKSIYNPITLLTNGFKKVFNYSVLKKFLLLGYIAASMFILFSVSKIFAAYNIKDEDFIVTNKSYVSVIKKGVTIDEYNKLKALNNVNYILPGNAGVSFNIKYNTYLQNNDYVDNIQGILASINLITAKDLKYGRMPQNDYEVVIDEMVLKNLFEANYIPKQVGILNYKAILNYHITKNNMPDFIIVGISHKSSPSIYLNNDLLINVISNSNENIRYLDYKLKPNYTLKKGKLPQNDYETVINYKYSDYYPLNNTLTVKINNTKLKVVGYYESAENSDYFLVNNNTILINLLTDTNRLMISSNNKDVLIQELQKQNYDATDTYQTARNKYIVDNKENVHTTLIVSGIIIGISLIEIFLMMRSSFLSRIKEIGTLRAIGVKRSDIYKMFLGEILAISIITSVTGISLMGYIIYNLTKIPNVGKLFVINSKVIILSVVSCFIFNIIVGLIPVANVMRKTPAAILSRHDI
jgi:putative ABC transport system permease protein